MTRLLRWWQHLRPSCPICGTRCIPTGLKLHLAEDHTDAELARYLQEADR